ncbi:MAG: hypothetical protein AAF618_04515 [Pseudomonadota bacterium]
MKALSQAVILCVVSSTASAQSFACRGATWTLDIGGLQARFVFPSPTQMDIPSVVVAEGADWPRAYTLIGDRDTAIVLIHDRACEGGTHETQVFTQRGQSPILLSGCCEMRP